MTERAAAWGTPAKWLKRLAGAWFLACCVPLWAAEDFTQPAMGEGVPLLLLFGGVALVCLLFALLDRRFPRARLDDYLLVGGACLYGWNLVFRYTGADGWAFCAAVLAALFLVLFPVFRQKDFVLWPLPFGKAALVVTACVCGLFFVAAVGTITCLRYLGYTAPNFDFGIFSQMFHSMRTTLLPMTTCERDGLLSHFAVHISPIFYLLLPVYALFPSPLTLQLGQAVVIASGIAPLCLLARRYGLSYKMTACLSVVYAGYAVLATGCFYDLHENCFLTPLLLWLFAAYEYRRHRLLYVAAAAVLLVKEDAAVYLLIFAAYLFFVRKERRHGAVLAGVAVGYFALALGLLAAFGEGAMLGRYANLLGEGGLVGLLKTLVSDPGFFLAQIFRTSSGDGGKWLYLLQLLLPLGFLPVLCRRPGRWLLLAPLLLNLLTTYPYMYDTGFQYSFGIAAFLLYLTVMNLAELSPTVKRGLLAFSAAAACLTFTATVLPRWQGAVRSYADNRPLYQQMDAILETVPADASVTASCMLVPHLSERAELYEVFYHPEPDTDYVVLDMRPGYRNDALTYRERCQAAGYTVVGGDDQTVEVWKRAKNG